MKYYFAPMEGITGYLYRNAHRKHFAGIDQYYAPFIGTNQNGVRKAKEIRDILPENNENVPLVPQLLTNNAQQFVEYQKCIADLGYTEVNLNLGCPSRTVVSKKKGAGFLSELWDLECFLDQIFAQSEIDVSIKTRIGMESAEEFPELMEIYSQYPIRMLTIHPRTQKDYYKNTPDWTAFQEGLRLSSCPVCYNGDICSVEDMERLEEAFPALEHVMIGRGLLINPGLAGELSGNGKMRLETLKAFHDELYESYKESFSGERPVLFKMKEFWVYVGELFPKNEKVLKKVKKAQRFADYDAAVYQILQGVSG